jgi:F0F1-type ATP synthase assembly protein I
VSNSSDDRSPLAQAISWSSRITMTSLETVLPALVGHWLDLRLGTGVVFAVLGALVGMAVGMTHLIRIAGSGTSGVSGRKPTEDRDSAP